MRDYKTKAHPSSDIILKYDSPSQNLKILGKKTSLLMNLRAYHLTLNMEQCLPLTRTLTLKGLKVQFKS